MPKSEVFIELDNPADYFEILKGDKFKGSRVEFKAEKNKLLIKVSADDPKALISTLGSVFKQVRIIDQTKDLVGR